MITLKQSMLLAGQNLINMLSPDHHYLPYFWMRFDEKNRAKMQLRWASHNVGRWWDALLRLEAATAFVIPEEIESAMLDNLKLCLKGPLGLCRHIPENCVFDGHSHREIFLGLSALITYRKCEWALEAGKELCKNLDKYILGNGSWDLKRMAIVAREAGESIEPPLKYFNEHVLATHGRMIEGLVEFYKATGDDATLVLADRLAKYHYDFSTREDGGVPIAEYTHTHSLFGLYRGLLLYGLCTKQSKYIERIAVTYVKTVKPSFKSSGFISHDWGMEKKGETAAPGDAAQLALWLSKIGQGYFFDDAERWVRSRILPSQIICAPGLKPQLDDGADEHRFLDNRAIGAFGGMHTHPHGGKLSTLDITAADLHSLCDIYTHVVQYSQLGLMINFHFDFDDNNIHIECHTSDRRQITIQSKGKQKILIRIPKWVQKESIQLKFNAKPAELQWLDEYILINFEDSIKTIIMEYDLPIKMTEETLEGKLFQFKWRGDEIVGVSPNTDYLPFYPDL